MSCGVWLLSVLAACSAPGSTAANAASDVYRIEYHLTPQPEREGVAVRLTLDQSEPLLRRYDMRAGAIDTSTLEGDGTTTVVDGRIVWEPPDDGGSLTWFVPLQHRRRNNGYDAYITPDWAMFRAEDAVPSMRTLTLRGATSETLLRFELPNRWSSLTEYFGEQHQYPVIDPERDFDRPTGWILLGRIGRRIEDIAGVKVIVAGPQGQRIRRMDSLALLQWALPELVNVLPRFPSRLTIFSARDPMWRGGLSAPASLYIHADRPSISENGTSTLLHEIVHVATGLHGRNGGDWIVEGLAEYYSLEALRRSGTISERRYERALEQLRRWSTESEGLCVQSSSGPTTALAVQTLVALNRDIEEQSDRSLDDVLGRLVDADRDVTVALLQSVVEDIVGSVPDSIKTENLPGCG